MYSLRLRESSDPLGINMEAKALLANRGSSDARSSTLLFIFVFALSVASSFLFFFRSSLSSSFDKLLKLMPSKNEEAGRAAGTDDFFEDFVVVAEEEVLEAAEEEDEDDEEVVVAVVVVVVVAEVVVPVEGDGGEEEETGSREVDGVAAAAFAAFLAFRSDLSRCLMPNNRSLSLSFNSTLGKSGIKCSNSSSFASGRGASQAGHFPAPIFFSAFSATIHLQPRRNTKGRWRSKMCCVTGHMIGVRTLSSALFDSSRKCGLAG